LVVRPARLVPLRALLIAGGSQERLLGAAALGGLAVYAAKKANSE
jgi:hypothetical protein